MLRLADSLLALRFWLDPEGDGTHSSYSNYGYRSMPQSGMGDSIKLNLSFMPGGLLSGSIWANDTSSGLFMQSEGTTFEMVSTSSGGGPCSFHFPSCSGELGELRAEIPEPSSAAIAGLGLLAAWFSRRRRS